ncbi:MAG: soluble lytic murein transglycosylase Slt [Rhodobacteraceae bacterium HLUCCA08]|nr:MAG: soluble lytic murein transglycosylase Slt [Rhodobacteraceae bacterium HLUCCA08]
MRQSRLIALLRPLALALAMGMAPVATAQETPGRGNMAAMFAAMQAGTWDVAYALAGSDVVARDLVTWMRLRDGDAVLADYSAFLTARPDWPGQDSLLAAAERSIPKGLPPDTVLAFFADRMPLTGQGAVRLAEARFAGGQPDAARAGLVATWRDLGLDDEGFEAVIEAFPDIVAPHHADRADMLLWRWRVSDAGRLLPYLDDDRAALVAARIGYIRKSADAEALADAVPAALRDDPGLAQARFIWLADRGERTEAIAILQERSSSPEALGVPWRWASWRRILARWDMREGRIDRAYALATGHHLTEGGDYADLEWLAGYLALTYMDEPALALEHFQRFDAAVETPISRARAGYWLGRAHEALDDPISARGAYVAAARHQTAFYGLLAAERAGLELDPDLAGGELFPDWQAGPLLDDDRTRAALMLLGGGERGLAVLFLRALAEDLDRDGLGQLGQLLMEMDEPFYALLVAKVGVARGEVVPDILFPLHGLARGDWPVEPALALAIARQESEFRTDAGSPVGALGLMQLMPATAQEVATELDLPYSRQRLVTDWQYNAALGTRYLANLEAQFGASPVMIAAGYNAGPSRPRQWIGDRGDPRLGQIDPVDWIEHIPFRETRNYVMRVTEAMPIYRARLTGEAGAVEFEALLRGALPVIRPMARPHSPPMTPAPNTVVLPEPPIAAEATDEESARPDPGEAAAAPGTSPRPRARP